MAVWMTCSMAVWRLQHGSMDDLQYGSMGVAVWQYGGEVTVFCGTCFSQQVLFEIVSIWPNCSATFLHCLGQCLLPLRLILG